MPLSRRYTPEWAPGENANIGIDLSFIIPPGVGISSGDLQVFTNNAVPALSSDFTIGPVAVQGRAIYATLGGGVAGQDYQLRWSATDTDGNVWPRTALLLCALTS
jgi:hypothetical protein